MLKESGNTLDLKPRKILQSVCTKYLEICELDPARFLSASGLVWQECLK